MILSREIKFTLSEDITKENIDLHEKFESQLVDGILTVLPNLSNQSLADVKAGVKSLIAEYSKDPRGTVARDLDSMYIDTILDDSIPIDLSISLKKSMMDTPLFYLAIFNV